MADVPYTEELREAYRQPPKWERYTKNPKTGKRRDQWQDWQRDSRSSPYHIDKFADTIGSLDKYYKPKLNKYGEPKLYLNELDIIELQFALGMFRDIYINNIHNMKYKEKMREAHWYADYALLICKNAAKSETERRYNEWRTNEIQHEGRNSKRKPHEHECREERGWGWYK